jgi:Icc-related predicted phosphoesterase
MRILAISDRVEEKIYSTTIKHFLGDVDLVLACGDLPFSYMEFIITKLNVPLLYVFGNHDEGIHTSDGQFKGTPMGGINLDNRVAEIKGLLVAGLEGSMRYSYPGTHQYTEAEMRWKALRMAPFLWLNRLHYGRFLDILITHAPPYRIHDDSDLCHTGFKAFLWIMRTFRPRYLIHGHQHVYSPSTTIRTRYRDTLVINTYGHQLIDWEEA